MHEDLFRHLAAEMEEPFRATGASDEELEILADHLMEKSKDFDEIRLPGSVRADQNIEWPQIQGLVPDRFEASYSNAVEAVHRIRSLALLWVASNSLTCSEEPPLSTVAIEVLMPAFCQLLVQSFGGNHARVVDEAGPRNLPGPLLHLPVHGFGRSLGNWSWCALHPRILVLRPRSSFRASPPRLRVPEKATSARGQVA